MPHQRDLRQPGPACFAHALDTGSRALRRWFLRRVIVRFRSGSRQRCNLRRLVAIRARVCELVFLYTLCGQKGLTQGEAISRTVAVTK